MAAACGTERWESFEQRFELSVLGNRQGKDHGGVPENDSWMLWEKKSDEMESGSRELKGDRDSGENSQRVQGARRRRKRRIFNDLHNLVTHTTI